MSTNTPKRNNRRATIFVTGPHTKKTIYEQDEQKKEVIGLKDIELARQRLQHDMVVMNTANSIEILVQIIMDECEIMRHNIRESGEKMRGFVSKNYDLFRQMILKYFVKNRKILEYKRDEEMILNESKTSTSSWKPPRYTFNDVEEVMTTDDLEDGVIQRRSQKWDCLPVRIKNEPIEDDSFCEFRKLNQPMSMIFEDEDEDRLSMPSTRTVQTQEDQMQAIQLQLAMLSKQLMTMQKNGASANSRASSRKGGRRMEKKSSIDITSSSPSSSDYSEDEGKGASLYSPSSTIKKVKVEKASLPPPPPVIASQSVPPAPPLPPIVAPPVAPPPPPPPSMIKSGPPSNVTTTITPSVKKSPLKEVENTVTSDRPYLVQIANGRSLLKKTARSPGGSPLNQITQSRRHLSTLEAALRDRFRGFHGEGSFSEQEEEEDGEANATWDEE